MTTVDLDEVSHDHDRPGPTDSPDRLLHAFVARKVSGLQKRYHEGQPAAVASLARLRRAVNASPGSDPAVWPETFNGFPDALIGRGDAPTAYESAMHTALTVYAIHQQSQRGRMHQEKYPLGRSVRLLIGRSGSTAALNAQPVMRRFHALGTATSYAETSYHLRGIVTLLRGEAIPLDYAQLAVDLRQLQSPRTADVVRMRWGRDLHRDTTSPAADGTKDQNETAGEAGSTDIPGDDLA